MLRHLKLKELTQRNLCQANEQKAQENDCTEVAIDCPCESHPLPVQPAACEANLAEKRINKKAGPQLSRAARNRRASKPAMEKRRRARINECLNLLKSYVLHESSNLLGLDATTAAAANENQDEESVAQLLLKSSGLINRHRGRKNPNKLEKADILELTVDYVRRLHEQRDELLEQQQAASILNLASRQTKHSLVAHEFPQNFKQTRNCHLQVPAHLNEPLTLDLSPRSRLADLNNSQPTPPPSSASSSPTYALADQTGHHHLLELARPRYESGQEVSRMILSQVLTTSNGARLY